MTDVGTQIDSHVDLLRISVGESHYAIEAEAVREIINPLPLVELPSMDATVQGVADYRDHILVVVDLRRWFDAPVGDARPKWVVLRTRGRRIVAVVVDAVVEVFSCPSAERKSVPRLADDRTNRGIEWALRRDGELIFVLSAQHLAKPAQSLTDSELSPEAR